MSGHPEAFATPGRDRLIGFVAGFLAALALVAVITLVGLFGDRIRGRASEHVLSEPRLVMDSGGRGVGILPAGTAMRYRGGLPEGGDYYEVVVRAPRRCR